VEGELPAIRHILSTMCFVSAALLVMSVTAPQENDSLQQAIRQRIAELPGARVAVAYRHLGRPDSLMLQADTSYHAASTMKVPVMIALFQKVDAGVLQLTDSVPLRNEFRSIVDSSVYELGPSDDSDSALYERVGGRVTVGELIERMIIRSSNLATNAVIDLAGGGSHITARMRALGAGDIQVRRGVEDGKAYRAGLNNTTTARDLAAILAELERGRAASAASTRAMREILTRQEFNEGIPAGLPPGTRVAHKTGWITATAHDAAVVYPEDGAPYVLVVLTGGIARHEDANRLTADIARLVHAHATSGRQRAQ
jgi:beta-lactamase class A